MCTCTLRGVMNVASKQLPVFALLLALAGSHASRAQSRRQINVEKSVLTVRVYKTGLFSAFAHDHEVRAPIQSGSFDEQKPSVEFKVITREMKVLDPGVSESDRSQVQSTMLSSKVLDSDRFGEISFRSTSVESDGPSKWRVQGELALHGQTRPVTVEVEGSGERYRGSARLRQTEFGITPISIGGGAIKVKDEILIEFEIVGK